MIYSSSPIPSPSCPNSKNPLPTCRNTPSPKSYENRPCITKRRISTNRYAAKRHGNHRERPTRPIGRNEEEVENCMSIRKSDRLPYRIGMSKNKSELTHTTTNSRDVGKNTTHKAITCAVHKKRAIWCYSRKMRGSRGDKAIPKNRSGKPKWSWTSRRPKKSNSKTSTDTNLKPRSKTWPRFVTMMKIMMIITWASLLRRIAKPWWTPAI